MATNPNSPKVSNPDVVGEPVVDNSLPKVKHLVVPLSKANRTNADGTVLSIPDADKFVGSFIEKGYHLVSTHFTGESPEYYSMIYVLSM